MFNKFNCLCSTLTKRLDSYYCCRNLKYKRQRPKNYKGKLVLRWLDRAVLLKAGFYLNLSEVLRGLKIEGIKIFLEHHQTLDIHARALQVVSGLF